MTEPLEVYIERIQPAVERYVRRHVRDRDDAAEIIGYVSLAITRSWANFRGECPPEAYAIRVAANAVKNYFTRVQSKRSLEFSLSEWNEGFQLQHAGELSGPYKQLESVASVETLLAEMETCCNPVEKGVVRMLYQGISLDEISKLTGMNPSSVRSHFLRARKKLLAHLLCQTPDLLGGREVVLKTAQRQIQRDPNFLTEAEYDALSDVTTKATNEHLRSAMLKLAPYIEEVG